MNQFYTTNVLVWRIKSILWFPVLILSLVFIFFLDLKIALVEGGFHHEVVRSYALMMWQQGADIHLFTNRYVYDQLNSLLNQKVQWHIEEGNAFQSWIELQKGLLETMDFVLITSPQTTKGEFITALGSGKKQALVLHDLHNDFAPWSHLTFWNTFHVVDFLKTIKYMAKGYFSLRKKALSSFDYLVVTTDVMAQYGKSENFFNSALVLPFLWNEFTPKVHERDAVKIVVPGTINSRSRAYGYLAEVLRKMMDKGLNTSIELVLLGKAKSKKDENVMHTLQSLATASLKITQYTGEVKQAEFDRQMMDADFLFLPLQHRWTYGVVDERGGWSCISGNIGDMVRFGLPVWLPNHYVIPQELEVMVQRFSMVDADQDASLISNYVLEKRFNQQKNQAPAVFLKFNEKINLLYQKLLEILG